MDIKTPNNTNSITSDDGNIRSRIRRLRIQEGLLLQSVQKFKKYTNEENDFYESELNSSGYKSLLLKKKDSYIYLKNLFDEIKTNTQSQELLADLDIEEMKKKVSEMESAIKTFKMEINTELAALRESYKQINEISPETEKVTWRPKTNSVNFTSIVPSPVRVLMSSPFKCLEVQQFQDFMQNSPNRYGGWTEYNHNVFVKYWQKYFGKDNVPEMVDKTLLQSVTHDTFIEDLEPRLHDVSLTDIATHIEWYTKYLQLKDNQKNAIEKWKLGRLAVKKVPNKVKYTDDNLPLGSTSMDDQNLIACHFTSRKHDHNILKTNDIKVKRKPKKHDRASSLMKPTKQWINRNRFDCAGVVGASEFECDNIDNMDKLGTPNWRLGL